MSASAKTAREIFVAAVKLAPEQWDAYLSEACGGDDILRARVRDLLRAHREAGSFLAPAVVEPALTADAPPAEQPGMVIGPYKLLEQIGEGGFGVVYLAEQTEPVRRKVALKILKLGMDTRQVVARFEAERQALAIMDHPNIAKVFDGGTTPPSPPSQGGAWGGGRPYFVMELVKGVPITQFCDEHKLSPRQRLELFVPVCHAVQHAHQKGIIHRDLKPSNVLVTRHDTTPVVKVIDFGVAKALGQELTDKTLFTGLAQMVGTPLYMSPEQAGMSDLDIDTRSDIYSLGVLLYELLTGTTPFTKDRFKQAAYDEIRRIIREEEPPKPSTRLSDSKDSLPSISAQRQIEPAKLTKLVKGELDWIVMKALEKDRSRRYETANGFAMDVQRYLADEAVEACPPSAAYRLRKFTRRNKALLTTIGLVAAALLIGAVVSVWQAIRATNAEISMAQERDAATTAEGRATDSANKAEIQRGIAVKNEKAAKENESLAKRRYYTAQMNLAGRAWEDKDTPRVLELLETQRPRFGESDLRAFEWYALWQMCHQQLRFSHRARFGAAYTVAFSPDSSTIALGSSDGTVKLIDAANGREVRTLRGGGTSRRGAVAFSPDGKLLAQAGSGEDDVILWTVRTGEQARILSGSGTASVLAFSPDGKTLATGANENEAGGAVCLWETATGLLQHTWKTGVVRALGFSPDGKVLVTSNDWGHGTDTTRFWDVTATPPKFVRELQRVGNTVAFSADGKRFAVGRPFVFEVFDTDTWKEIPVKKGPWGMGRSLAFVPGQNAVVVGVDSRSVRRIDLETGQADTFAHHARVDSLAVAPNGKAVAAIGTDGLLKVWNLDAATDGQVVNVGGSISALGLSADGQTLAVGMAKAVKLFDVPTSLSKRQLTGHSLHVRAFAFFRDDTKFASGSGDWATPGELKLWDLRGGKEAALSPEFNAAVLAISVSPDEKTLATCGPQSDLAIFDVATAKLKNRVNARGLTVLTHSTDGKLLITGNGDGRIGLRDSTTGAERLSFAPKETAGIAWSLCCSRDGSLLASGHQGGAIYLWQLPSGRLHAALRGNTSAVGSLAFFPDGKTLASSNDNGEVKLWDVATGQERVTFRLGHRLALSRDGQTLVAGTKSKAWVIRASTAAEALDRKSELNTDDPESPLADLDGGDRHWVAGEKHEAEEAYRRGHDRLQALVDHFPEDTHCRRELVRSALSMRLLLLDPAAAGAGEELWRQAQAHYQKLPPEEQLALARSYSTMAERLRKAGSKEAALRTHTLATELKADDPSVWFSRAYFFGANGESAQAIAAYRRAVELSPNSAEHHNNLARMLATTPEAKLRDFAQAVTLAKKAVEIAPKKGAYHNTLGVAHYGAGDWKAALGSLEKSMELRKGGDSHDWFFLAMTHWQLGAKDKARAWYDRAVQWMDKNQPDNEELRRFRAEAAELLGLNEKK